MCEGKTRAVLHPGRKTALKTAIRRSAVDRLVQLVPEDVEQFFFIVRPMPRKGRAGMVDPGWLTERRKPTPGILSCSAVARPDHMRFGHSPELVGSRVGFGGADDGVGAPKVALKRRGETSGELQYFAGMPLGGTAAAVEAASGCHFAPVTGSASSSKAPSAAPASTSAHRRMIGVVSCAFSRRREMAASRSDVSMFTSMRIMGILLSTS